MHRVENTSRRPFEAYQRFERTALALHRHHEAVEADRSHRLARHELAPLRHLAGLVLEKHHVSQALMHHVAQERGVLGSDGVVFVPLDGAGHQQHRQGGTGSDDKSLVVDGV